jgi:hypothetical protein
MRPPLLHADDIRALVGVGGLRAFVSLFWRFAEPGVQYIDTWHMGAVCEWLQAFHDGEFDRGVLNLPPGCSKSLLADVFLPAYTFAHAPAHKWLGMSYDIGLLLRDGDKMQAILESPPYREIWPRTELKQGRQARGNVWTTMGGYRFATTPAGKGLGRHFNTISVNDPIKSQDAVKRDVSAAFEQVDRWWDSMMPTRDVPGQRFGWLLTMQRLAEHDRAGKCLAQRNCEHLCLPMRYEPKAQWIIGEWSAKLDIRTQPGELLCPELKNEERVRQTEIALGHEASAQLQQNPVPRAGGLLSERDLRWEWAELPSTGALYCQVWDFAAKGTEATHSAVSGQLWCVGVPGGVHRHHDKGSIIELMNTISDRDRGEEPLRQMRPAVEGQSYAHLVDERWGIWSVPESERQFELAQSAPMWDRAGTIVIEAKAAGIGIIQRYARKFPAIRAFHEIDDTCAALARDDKVTRHRTNLGEYTAGRVLLPPWYRHTPDPVDPRDGAGPDRFRNELVSFPYGARDDRVDSASMALAVLVQGKDEYWASVRALAGC